MCLKRIKLTVAALALSACGASAAGEARFVPLDTLFDTGIRHSLLLEADRIGQQMAAARRESAQSQRLPELSVGLNAGVIGQPVVFRRGLSQPTRPDAPDWNQNYALDFSQPIYQGGKLRYAIRKADMERSLSSLQTANDKADLKLTLLDEYMQLFSLYRQQQVLTRNIEESQRRLQDIRRMKEEGLITTNDVLRSEMQLTNDELSLQEAQNGIILASQRLDIRLGLDESQLIEPDTTLLYRPITLEPYEQYVQGAYQDDPFMQQLRMKTELAKNDIALARSALRPNLSLYASNTLARPISRTLEDLYNNNWNIGLSLSLPLFAFYKSNHKVKQSQLAVSLSQNAEDQEKQHIRLKVRTAYLRHQEARDQVEALQLSAQQAQENYRIMQNRYMNQVAILTDLLDANAVRLDVELQLTAARTRVIYTYYQLLRACGRL